MANKKETKKDLFGALKECVAKINCADANLVKRAEYAIQMATKDLTKVTSQDFKDLISEFGEALKANQPAPVENLVKPLKKPASKTSGEKKDNGVKAVEEKPAEKETEKPAEKPVEAKEEKKAPAKSKDKVKKPAIQKPKVEEAKTVSAKSLTTAKIFPAEIEVKDLGTLTCKATEFKTMADVTEAINEGREIYFVAYWTARQLKEYDYAGSNKVPCPKAFDNDLDIMMAVVTCSNIERVWCMSAYTEAMYNFDGEDLEPVTDKDVDGNEYAVRVSNGMEFEIYEKIAK